MKRFFLAAVSTLLITLVNGQGHLQPDILRCDYRVNPLGIDDDRPLFAWSFTAGPRGQYQRAYRLLVASSVQKLKINDGDIWDSGIVSSDDNVHVIFKGKPPHPFTRYFWKVKAYSDKGIASDWSTTAWFETAFLTAADWCGTWISDPTPDPIIEEDFYKERPAPDFQKSIRIGKKIAAARLYITGPGYYEAYLNGEKIGDQVLDPGWTNYGKTVLYSTYDVTRRLVNGTNTLAVTLGNGWYDPLPLKLFGAFDLRKTLTIGHPCLLANLRIFYTDGTVDVIATDSSWMTRPGYILKNNIYLGEVQDGRLRSTPSQKWRHALAAPGPAGQLTALTAPPIRITKEILAVSVSEPVKGVYVVDMGRNFAGWAQFKLRGKAGETVHFRYGELLYPDGRVNGMTTVAGHIKAIWRLNGGPGSPPTAYQEDAYTCAGDGKDLFRPHFTFHAFRYIEITGLSVRPSPGDVTGLRLNSAVDPSGSFTCSDTLFNRIQENTLYTFLSNLFSVQSDCPGRERQGYGADMVTSCEAYIFNYDMSCFYQKTIKDFANDRRAAGGMPECAPYNGIATEGYPDGAGPIGWQLAFPYLQQQLYRFYGNRKILADNYPLTKDLVEFLRSQSKDDLFSRDIGDHVSIDAKHVPLTSTAFYYHHVSLLAGIAGILGNQGDARKYDRLAADIATAFDHQFLDTLTGACDTAANAITQTFALWYDLVPGPLREKALRILTDKIIRERKGHFSTGIFGTKMLFDVLRRTNQDSLAVLMTTRPDYPGYAWMIRNGATTLWETWERPAQDSWNHPMFGSVSEWFYRSLLGINPADDAEGMDRIVLRPYTGGGLNYARGCYSSIRGKIVSEWKKEGTGLGWTVAIPGNVHAKIYVPANDLKMVREGGLPLGKAPGLRYIGAGDGYQILESGSGTYHFTVTPSANSK